MTWAEAVTSGHGATACPAAVPQARIESVGTVGQMPTRPESDPADETLELTWVAPRHYEFLGYEDAPSHHDEEQQSEEQRVGSRFHRQALAAISPP